MKSAENASSPCSGFNLELVERGDALVLRLAGELDIGASMRRADVFSGVHPAPGVQLAVDVSGLTFIDARGLSALIGVHKRLLAETGSGIVVQGARGIVLRVFEITGMAALLDDSRPPAVGRRELFGMPSLTQTFDRARREFGLSPWDLYVDYVALGGTASPAALHAHLQGDPEALDRHQRDVTAHAINEHLVESGHRDLLLPYLSDLRDLKDLNRSGASAS